MTGFHGAAVFRPPSGGSPLTHLAVNSEGSPGVLFHGCAGGKCPLRLDGFIKDHTLRNICDFHFRYDDHGEWRRYCCGPRHRRGVRDWDGDGGAVRGFWRTRIRCFESGRSGGIAGKSDTDRRPGSTTTVLDSNGRLLTTLDYNCAISGVYPLRNAVFRLTDRIDQTIYLLDATSTEERILFVPPPQE